jgi:hypothetical protein
MLMGAGFALIALTLFLMGLNRSEKAAREHTEES